MTFKLISKYRARRKRKEEQENNKKMKQTDNFQPVGLRKLGFVKIIEIRLCSNV